MGGQGSHCVLTRRGGHEKYQKLMAPSGWGQLEASGAVSETVLVLSSVLTEMRPHTWEGEV